VILADLVDFPSDNAIVFKGEFMSPRRRDSATATTIRRLAEQHRVAFHPTRTDVLAHHMTRLAGDTIVLDEVEQMLIALQRAGHLSRAEAVRLQAKYLRQAKS
jgi:hypothetical protein